MAKTSTAARVRVEFGGRGSCAPWPLFAPNTDFRHPPIGASIRKVFPFPMFGQSAVLPGTTRATPPVSNAAMALVSLWTHHCAPRRPQTRRHRG